MHHLFKKIIICVALVGTFIVPQVSYAQVAVTDGPLTVVAKVIATNTTITAANGKSLTVKEFVLDQIVYVLAEQIIQQITSSIVNWINTGFDGNPSFVSNPGEFFKDVGDQFLGEMIMSDKYLGFLCTPFSIDLRLALAFKYQPFQRRISCTLSDVIANSTNAVEGASINGFTAGDFSQGGWPAFVEMTTQPQSNQYGAFVQADYDLSARIGKYELLKRDELNQGRGFLSWKKCEDIPVSDNPEVQGPPDQKCVTQTPGSVIAGVLDANNEGPMQRLNLADEINEIVNAVFAQMVTKVLTVGYRGLSGNGASDPASYANQLQNQQAATNQQLISIRNQILQGIDEYINRELEIKIYYDGSLNKYVSAKNSLDSVKTCFANKLADPEISNRLSSDHRDYAQGKIGEAELIIQQKITTKSSLAFSKAQGQDQLITSLRTIKQTATAAQTVNEISAPAQAYASLTGSSQLHTVLDLENAKEEQQEIEASLQDVRASAARLNQLCSLFPQTRVR